jgi:WD40 repeat protein
LWDLESPEPISLITQGLALVFEVAFSPDGNYLAATRQNGSLLIFDLSGEEIRQVLSFRGQTGEVFSSLTWSPDGQRLAAGNNSADMITWRFRPADENSEVQLEQEFRLSAEEDHFQALSWPSENLLISGHAKGKVVIWEPLTGNLVTKLDGHTERVYSLGVSPDKRFFLSGASDYSAILWDLETLEPIQEFSFLTWILAAGFSPLENTFVTSSGGDLRVYEIIDEQKLVSELDIDFNINILETLVSGPGDEVLAIEHTGIRARDVWEISSGDFLGSFSANSFPPYGSVSLAPNAGILVADDGQGLVQFWDLESGDILEPQIQAATTVLDSLAINVNGTALATSHCIQEIEGEDDVQCEKSLLRFWELPSGQRTSEIAIQGRQTSLAFSPQGNMIAMGQENGKVLLSGILEISQGRFSGYELPFTNAGAVRSLAFSPDGLTLASGDSSGALVFWDVETGQPIGEPLIKINSALTGLAFAGDGTELITGHGTTQLFIWNVSLPFWRERACETAGRNFSPSEWRTFISESEPESEREPTCPQFPLVGE